MKTVFCSQANREDLLFIDEVDKSSDNQMFLNFLGVLRELYLERAFGTVAFKRVILAGVYDIKNLKGKMFLLGLKMAWGIAKFVCTVILLPLFLIGLVLVGLMYVAVPILLIAGIAVLVKGVQKHG